MGLTISDFFFTYSRFYCTNTHFMKKHMKIKKIVRILIEEYIK